MVLFRVLGPIISYNCGVQNKKRIWDTVKISLLVATMLMVICFILSYLFTYQLIIIFNQEANLIDFTTHSLHIYFLALPVFGVTLVGSNYFQAIGKYRIAIFFNLLRQVLILGPLILVFAHFWQLDGILYACPVSDVLSFLVVGIFLLFEYFRYYK